ncbi:MAG: hypothetical protein U9O98_08340 [Asgard group archaeon]|nr:hypothetical protein [Asgard group archaeon]
MDPRRFKFILLVPLYVMVGVGGYIAISAIIKGIIIAVQGVDTTSLVVRVIDKIDLVVVNEYYKGIIISVVIVIFYILPSIKLLKDPEAQIGPQRLDGRRRKISDWWKRRVTKDYRTLINRQFEDLRKHYWDIKQIIAKALLIPIGLAQLIVAPIGGMAVVMGIKTSVQRKKLEKYELVIQIIIGVALIGLLLASSFTLVARQIRSLPAVMIISKLLYGLALIFSFYTFTRMPIAQTDKI